MGGFRTFYSALLNENDMGSAVRAISQCRLSYGRWLSEPAELWFETLVTGYVKEHCNKEASQKRAKEMFRILKKQGNHVSTGAILRMLRKQNKADLPNKYFEIYFITEQIPENSSRFENTLKRVETKLAELRDSGQYFA